ncbi:MAG: hypothetical protein ACP5NE_02625 [Candidatus Micrarchaeia archaeon]
MYLIAGNSEETRAPVYGENWSKDTKEEEQKQESRRGDIEIAGALIFWIIMILIGVLIKIAVMPILSSNGVTQFNQALAGVSSAILYIPGSIIIALIVAAYIGEKVGAAAPKASIAARVGVINAIYASFIYLIIIAILYMIIKYADNAVLPNLQLSGFLTYMVGLPIAILLIVVPILSALSAERHNVS